ncbi:hypothetical protein MAR_014272 [Mya arenaria]|uniref:Uncharacterized protein n=1 Tax=Mya arenaria TaxID=6604 RepID=A0ABY7G5W8_MYAAR|nr:hypothetical protein MAR_014272 [Mya arenaria]
MKPCGNEQGRHSIIAIKPIWWTVTNLLDDTLKLCGEMSMIYVHLYPMVQELVKGQGAEERCLSCSQSSTVQDICNDTLAEIATYLPYTYLPYFD